MPTYDNNFFYNEESAKLYSDLSQVLEHDFGDKKLKDIMSEMEVLYRSF